MEPTWTPWSQIDELLHSEARDCGSRSGVANGIVVYVAPILLPSDGIRAPVSPASLWIDGRLVSANGIGDKATAKESVEKYYEDGKTSRLWASMTCTAATGYPRRVR